MPELRNTFNSQQRGLWAEAVAEKHYLKKGYRLLGKRVKTPFAEVDLLFQRSRQELILVEVKCLASFDFIERRLGKRQKSRLTKAVDFYIGRGYLAALELAVVSHKAEVLVFKDVFSI